MALPGGQQKHNLKATQKQITALQLINQGMSPTQAMLKAGYSKSSARIPKQALLTSQAVTSVVDKFKLELQDAGLTTAYMAAKFQEWLTATTEHGKPDYQTQQQAYRFFKEVVIEPDIVKKNDPNLISRKTISLEEYITPSKDNTPSLEEATMPQIQEIAEEVVPDTNPDQEEVII